MPGLGETTATLARLRRAIPTASGGQAVMTRTASFGPNPGQLGMLSYSPAGLAPRSPLVVVLHGCTQSAEAYAENAGWLALADRFGFMVLAAEQTSANNPNRCFNWFSPVDVRRGDGEAASIASMVGHLVKTHDLDAERVFVTGLSAGGAMASAMLAVYPKLFAGGAVIAGLPYGVAGNVQDALRVMSRADGRSAEALAALAPARRDDVAPPRLSIWHGDADFTVNVGNASDLSRQWSALHGLSSTPDLVETRPFGTQSTWRSPDGEGVVEMNLVSGLGHGAPLSTKAAGGVGKVAPYMLEAGVSSSLEIARFWKIDTDRLEATKPRLAESARPEARSEGPAVTATDLPDGASLGHSVMRLMGKVPDHVQEIVAKALRDAGLMKP